eukprot:CAMPEP_0115340802 /NCGR_PEP_ID=MMETSP0270-20121206/91338_1 /TAXON_ID=71861 /ORGANISM="Scrippsiella trochoidea, Strain CCMP3099" /LENGTH=32 /DNA_ID= /DNA_START= /DNA_END= /DNA_ORIENTATION=
MIPNSGNAAAAPGASCCCGPLAAKTMATAVNP